MALFFTNFFEYGAGSAPSGWTAAENAANSTWAVLADALASGGKVLRWTRGSASAGTQIAGTLAWVAAGQSLDSEIAARFRIVSLADDTVSQYPVELRQSIAATYVGHYAGVTAHASNVSTGLENSGTFTGETFASAVSLSLNTWYGIRLRVEPATGVQARRRAKAWLWNSAASDFGEPSGWQTDYTSGSLASNYAGLVGRGNTAGDSLDFDLIGVATAGEAAPLDGGSPGTPAVTISAISTAGATLSGSAFTDPFTGDTHGASQFRVVRATGGAVDYDSGAVSASVGPHTATGLTPGTAYLGQVRYQDQRGLWSAYGQSDFATPSPPAAPVVTVSEIRRTSARLTHSAFSPGSASPVHAATQARVRRISTGATVYGPANASTGRLALPMLAVGLPGGPEGVQGRPVVDPDLVAEVRHQDAAGLWSGWGASPPFQTLNLWESGEFATHVDVRVEIISGGATAMQSLRDFGGHNWIKEASISDPGVDQTIGTARIVLHRQIGGLSLAPLMTTSALNQDGGVFAPSLDFGREVEIHVCNKVPGEEPEEGDWIWKFAGVADDPEWPGKSGDVQLTARDYLGPVADAIMRTEKDYGDPDDPPEATEAMQAILDDRMGAGQYTIYDLTTGAGFAVKKYPVRDISALEAIENLAQQWGGKMVEQTWNPEAGEWQVGIVEPDREKEEPDYSVSPSTYLDVHTLHTDNRNLRTLVLGHAEDETGKILSSQLPVEADVATDPLILTYGERALIFSEEAAKGITTQEQLDEMVAAIYADASNPPLPLEPETKYAPFATVGDLPRWKANRVLFDEDQDAAALLLTHTFPSAGVGRTRWKCGGRPKGAYAAYRKLGVEVRGIGRRPAIFSLNLTHSPLGVLNATIIPGSDTVRWRIYDKVGGAPATDSLYFQGEYLRTVRTASWSVGNGTHYVTVQGYSDKGTYVEATDTLVVSGVPGDGGGGGTVTLAPGAPFLRAGPDFGPDEPTLESEWVNTSDTLDVRAVYYREGVAATTLNLAAGTTEDVGSYHAPTGSRVKVGVSYVSGGVEGPKAYSAEIVLGEEF